MNIHKKKTYIINRDINSKYTVQHVRINILTHINMYIIQLHAYNNMPITNYDNL